MEGEGLIWCRFQVLYWLAKMMLLDKMECQHGTFNKLVIDQYEKRERVFQLAQTLFQKLME